jgi:hypothetical protein
MKTICKKEANDLPNLIGTIGQIDSLIATVGGQTSSTGTDTVYHFSGSVSYTNNDTVLDKIQRAINTGLIPVYGVTEGYERRAFTGVFVSGSYFYCDGFLYYSEDQQTGNRGICGHVNVGSINNTYSFSVLYDNWKEIDLLTSPLSVSDGNNGISIIPSVNISYVSSESMQSKLERALSMNVFPKGKPFVGSIISGSQIFVEGMIYDFEDTLYGFILMGNYAEVSMFRIRGETITKVFTA